jgi:hypothetical protein
LQKTLLIGLLLTALVSGVYAQSNTAKIHVGTVHIDFDKLSETPGLLHLLGHAKMTSDDYDLLAADIKVYSTPGSKGGVSGVRQAVAEGGAAPGSQVIAHIRQPLQSEDFEINADRAVYLPDYTRPSGGAMKFTGHVKVITKSGFLAEPSLSTFESATVLLGAGPDYPRIDTGPGHITLTPAQ